MPSPMSSTFRRSVKRKLDQVSRGPFPPADDDGGAVVFFARIEVENEVSALREAVSRQQQTIQDLCSELDEERSAASSAANEAMSMILRLQREKAEVQMEFRQFKRFAEEKMTHDQQELIALDDLLFRRDQAAQALSCEIKAYKHRIMSYGVLDDPVPETSQQFEMADGFDYPQLRCMIPGENYCNDEDPEGSVLEKYTTTSRDQLQQLENRIYEMESENKAAACSNSGLIRDLEEEFKRTEDDNDDDEGGGDHNLDGESARVYMVVGVSSPERSEMGSEDRREYLVEDENIKKLYMRLQALEADRESMKQVIISMRTEKAQLVLLKEIAQQLCREVAPRRQVVRKSSPFRSFSFVAVMKWMLALVFWRKKASRSKYSFGLSNNNGGLLLLLDKSPRLNQWTYLSCRRG